MIVDPRALVAELETWDGVPFAHQGRSRAGVDCVGLAVCALSAIGVKIDAPADYMPNAGPALLLQSLDRCAPLAPLFAGNETADGDILVLRVLRNPSHVAIALSGGRMIHAAKPHGVRVVTLGAFWAPRVAARYRWRRGH